MILKENEIRKIVRKVLREAYNIEHEETKMVEKIFDPSFKLSDDILVNAISINYNSESDDASCRILLSVEHGYSFDTTFYVQSLHSGFNPNNDLYIKSLNLDAKEKLILRNLVIACLNENIDNIHSTMINEGYDNDNAVVNEMIMWCDNTRHLYEFKRKLIETLIKKMKKGENVTVERLAESRVIEELLHDILADYAREFGNFSLPTNIRKQIKIELAKLIVEDAEFEYNRKIK